MLAVNDGFALNTYSVPPYVRSTEMVEQHGTHVRIKSRAMLSCVLMSNDEERHVTSCGLRDPRA